MTGYAPQSGEQDINGHMAQVREENTEFAHWADGYGVIVHDETTQSHVYRLAERLQALGTVSTIDQVFRTLAAADRLTSAAMWLVVHMTYARRVRLDGRALQAGDFKADPEGHTGGSLNMVPAYVGYLTANALSGVTRSWLMGQGHRVSAIDAVNLLVGTLWPLLGNLALTPVLGYMNHGGTLDENGMLFANRCTWAHAVAAASGSGRDPRDRLTEAEAAALAGAGDPSVLFGPPAA